MRPRYLLLALPFLLATGSALAQTSRASPSGGGASSLNWAALGAGDDWAGQVLNSFFPSASVSGGGSGFTTVVGRMLGHISMYVVLLGMFYFAYASVVQIHRTGESGKLLSESFSGWVPVRVAMAVVCIMPTASGFSLGQQAVIKTATFGIGMARNLYSVVTDAVGPDAVPLVTPMVPGTKKLVLGLIEGELCRDIINLAANNDIVPVPSFQTGTAGALNAAGYVSLSYRLSSGLEFGYPTCGAVTLRSQPANAQMIAGVSTDMAPQQLQILKSVLTDDIRTQVQAVANQLWNTRQSDGLSALRPVLLAATNDYYTKLQAAASQVMSQLRSNVTRDQIIGSEGSADPGMVKMQALGWTAAGAYYLEIARLNGTLLGIMSGIPTVTPPSYEGLGMGLREDVTPIVTAIKNFENQLDAYVTVNDGDDVTGGGSALYEGAQPSSSGGPWFDQILRSIRLDERLLNAIEGAISPTSTSWNDPFAGLITLGQILIHAALGAMALTAILSSKAGAITAVAGNLLTGDVVGAVLAGGASMVMKAIAAPIYLACLAVLSPGLVLAYVLPATPFAIWIAGVAGWFVLVCEAVVLVPFWMLAHLVFQGEGLHGRGSAGYALLISILFRPVCMMAGLILGYVVFSAMSFLMMRAFGVMAGFILQDGWLVTNLLGIVVLLCMFVTMEMQLALMSFKLISTLPHYMPRLLGMESAGRVDMESFARDTTGEGMSGVLRDVKAGALAVPDAVVGQQAKREG